MSIRIVALDTETTGLDPATEAVFEIAVVIIDAGDGPGMVGDEYVWRIEPPADVVDAMHPKAAKVNRYHQRTADPTWRWDSTLDVLKAVHDALDGAHIVGAVPDFDTRHLTALYGEDEALAAAQEAQDRAERHADPDWKDACRRIIRTLARSGEPFTSDDVCAALDQVPESTHDRRAVGPMIAAAGRAGLIRKTGGWRRSTRRHGSMQWLWVGVAGGTSARWSPEDEAGAA